MILTCPQCGTRFLLPAARLAPEGSKVRCSNCQEIWFQEPDENELAEFGKEEGESNQETVQDEIVDVSREEEITIPDSVRPSFEQEEQAEQKIKSKKAWKFHPVLLGYGAGAVVFVLIFLMLIALRSPITQTVPAAQGFYNIFGMDVPVSGKTLVFDRIKAEVIEDDQQEQKVVVEGHIINLSAKETTVPMIEATLKDAQGDAVKTWLIEPPVASLKGYAQSAFHVEYPGHPLATDLHVRFVLGARKAKTVSEGGDNIHAHKPADDTHPSDGATHQEEHAPAPADHH